MKRIDVCKAVLLSAFFISCDAQPSPQQSAKLIGGGCDGCELMYEGMPDRLLSTDTSAGWHEAGQRLLVTGTVFKRDGQTPAPGVILYYWQTDNNGYYSPKPGMNEKAKRHGHIRGWVRTDDNGRYTICTIRPAPYPNDVMPAHIHVSVKEPGIANEYYIDEIVFDDDILLIPAIKRNPPENRGGSGIVRVLLKDDLQIAEHDIVLGLNIPDYPPDPNDGIASGLAIGEDQPSFSPFHAYGPDKGTQTCPVCKYGRYHGIIYFAGNKPDWTAIKRWLPFLEEESEKRKKYLKVYFVYGNEKKYNRQQQQQLLEELGKELDLRLTALTFVSSFSDTATEVYLNKINPEAGNTIIIYKNRRIVGKYINLKPGNESFHIISAALDKTQGKYFDLNGPPHN